MKILFVCQQYIHAARWINQLKNSGHDIYLFDCLDMPIHKDLKWTNFIENWSKRRLPIIKGEYFLKKKFPKFYEKILPILKVTASEKLVEVIKKIKPDLVHSLEMQSQSYHLLKAWDKVKFKWAYSCWGSDIYFYKESQKDKIKETLSAMDYFFLECKRDGDLIKTIKPNAGILGVSFPGGGGYDLKTYLDYKCNLKERNLILIKGYEHTFGRALNVLNAIEMLADIIKDYKIYVYSAHNVVIKKIEEMNTKYHLNIEYSSRYNEITHKELLQKFGMAKIAIGNSISDGVPNTLLEAIILGAFPIQSNPGGASEDYITDGENGFLIKNPEDVNEIAILIKKALNSSTLLENSFYQNTEKSKSLAYDLIKAKVLKAYSKIESEI